MQHDDGRRVLRRGTDHAVFEIGGADAQGTGGVEGLHDSFPESAPDVAILTRVVPANAGTHTPRPSLFRRLLPPRPIATSRGRGPRVRGDDATRRWRLLRPLP